MGDCKSRMVMSVCPIIGKYAMLLHDRRCFLFDKDHPCDQYVNLLYYIIASGIISI